MSTTSDFYLASVGDAFHIIPSYLFYWGGHKADRPSETSCSHSERQYLNRMANGHTTVQLHLAGIASGGSDVTASN